MRQAFRFLIVSLFFFLGSIKSEREFVGMKSIFFESSDFLKVNNRIEVNDLITFDRIFV